MLAKALALASFSALAAFAFSSAVSSGAAGLAAAGLAFVVAAFFAVVFLAVLFTDVAFGAAFFAFPSDALVVSSALARSSSAAALKSLVLELVFRFRAGAFFEALLAGFTTFFTCPLALANMTMSGFADLVAAGVIGVVSSGKEATGTCLDTALVAVFYESGGVANQETVNTSFFQEVFSSK